MQIGRIDTDDSDIKDVDYFFETESNPTYKEIKSRIFDQMDDIPTRYRKNISIYFFDNNYKMISISNQDIQFDRLHYVTTSDPAAAKFLLKISNIVYHTNDLENKIMQKQISKNMHYVNDHRTKNR